MINTQTATEYWNARGAAQPEAIGLTPERCNVTTDWTIQKQVEQLKAEAANARKTPDSYIDALDMAQQAGTTTGALRGTAKIPHQDWNNLIRRVIEKHTRCECHDCTQARWQMFNAPSEPGGHP